MTMDYFFFILFVVISLTYARIWNPPLCICRQWILCF